MSYSLELRSDLHLMSPIVLRFNHPSCIAVTDHITVRKSTAVAQFCLPKNILRAKIHEI